MGSLTADTWCNLAIIELRSIFKDKQWPLPDKIRAKQNYHWNVQQTFIIPAIDQDDGFAIIRYPSSLSHAERVIPAILNGLYRLAINERSRKGSVISIDFGRGSTTSVRHHIGLIDERGDLTRFGVAIVRKIVAKIGPFPEGSSHPKPHRRTTFSMVCSACGQQWFRQNREQYELSQVMGQFHCLLVDCGGVLVPRDVPDEDGDIIRMER